MSDDFLLVSQRVHGSRHAPELRATEVESGRSANDVPDRCGSLLGVGLLAFWIQAFAIFSVFERVTPKIIYRVRTSSPLVAISFDDGPHPTFTPEVLEIL